MSKRSRTFQPSGTPPTVPDPTAGSTPSSTSGTTGPSAAAPTPTPAKSTSGSTSRAEARRRSSAPKASAQQSFFDRYRVLIIGGAGVIVVILAVLFFGRSSTSAYECVTFLTPPPAAAPDASGAPAPSVAPATSGAPAPASPASAALDAAPTTTVQDAAAPTAATLQTVPRNFPLTPEGNAAFLASYRARADVTALPSGVMYRALVTGKGTVSPISRLDTVTVSYRGWLIDGTSFDNSPPGAPRAFQIGALVEGWREALLKMKVGDLWEVVVPAALAYGAEGRAGRIPPNQTLVFVISVAKIEYAG